MPGKNERSRSLRSTTGFETFVLDQLDSLGDVVSKKMFGGIGLYSGGVFFGIIARDELYFKVDGDTRPEYEAAGMHAFEPYPGRPITMQYFCVPVGVLESPVELTAWARKAVAAAGRRAAGSRSRRRSQRSAEDE